MRRMRSIGVVALIAAVFPFSGSSTVGAATGTMTPARSTIAAGEVLDVTTTGCPSLEPSGGLLRYQYASIRLIVGTGPDAVVAAIGQGDESGSVSLLVPGWVGADESVSLVGTCELMEMVEHEIVYSTPFTFPSVPIDVTAAIPGAITPTFTLSRSVAASGQAVHVTGGGCQPNSQVSAIWIAGPDLTFANADEQATTASGEAAADGTFAFDATLTGWSEDTLGLAEGPYAVHLACFSGDETSETVVLARPQRFDVVGTRPLSQLDVTTDDTGRYIISGTDCTYGAVTVTLTGYVYDGGELAFDARPKRASTPAALLRGTADHEEGGHEVVATLTATPGPDGAWSVEWTGPETGFGVLIVADCGDPFADGFRYPQASISEDAFADLWIDRVSPTTSPVGGPVTVHFEGDCDKTDRKVTLLDSGSRVVAEAPLDGPNEWGQWVASLTAPATAGEYRIQAMCGTKPSYPDALEVFAPSTLARTAPLPAEPTTGWPSEGPRETYAGRIGPITLPGEGGGMEMDGRAVRDLGPSALFIDVPKPAGDLAITGITFDLVDEHGMPVSQHDAHLHHFVIGSGAGNNPACPGSTFGIPGEIVAAVGAERTELAFPDPYGIVVKGSESWKGVYELMNRSGEDQTVFLTYDITYRRDVQNVRPVDVYFGSSTGCGSFTWTIDGNGTPDTQSTYVTMQKDGVLVGAGGHLHNGGESLDVVDDRGRRLCRSELQLGSMSVGHGGHDEEGWIPEYYHDALENLGISNCALREQVTKGQRVRVDTTYTNDRARSGVMGIYTMYLWDGTGPKTPTGGNGNGRAEGARPIRARPDYTG